MRRGPLGEFQRMDCCARNTLIRTPATRPTGGRIGYHLHGSDVVLDVQAVIVGIGFEEEPDEVFHFRDEQLHPGLGLDWERHLPTGVACVGDRPELVGS